MKNYLIFFHILFCLPAFAEHCEELKQGWSKTDLTIDQVEAINFDSLSETRQKVPADSELTKEDKETLINEVEKLRLTQNKEWQRLKSLYKEGDKLFLHTGMPFEFISAYCLFREEKLINEMAITDWYD